MADTKITALTALTGANSAPGDLLTIVDVSDTTMDAAGTNKSITRQELQTYNAGTLTTDVKVLDLSATWNNAAVTFTGLKFNVTNTASNAASKLFDLQVGGSSIASINRAGTITHVASTFTGRLTGSGASANIYFSNAPRVYIGPPEGGISLASDAALQFSSSTDPTISQEIALLRDGGTGALAQRFSTTAQTFRLYNTWTDASNYERLGITWSSNIVSIAPEAAGTGTVRVLHISGLPTSNPGPGILWNDSNTVKVGT
jgi:hypothetical protein